MFFKTANITIAVYLKNYTVWYKAAQRDYFLSQGKLTIISQSFH